MIPARPLVKIPISRRIRLCENESHVKNSKESRPQETGGRLKGVTVSYRAETPFDCIEGSHEYLKLLAESLDEARRDVEAEIAAADRERADRRKEALLLVSYNLAKLHLHITSSRRIMNDLRTLRRLLLAERGVLSEDDTEVRLEEGARVMRAT
jgi:hypothetical protein